MGDELTKVESKDIAVEKELKEEKEITQEVKQKENIPEVKRKETVQEVSQREIVTEVAQLKTEPGVTHQEMPNEIQSDQQASQLEVKDNQITHTQHTDETARKEAKDESNASLEVGGTDGTDKKRCHNNPNEQIK